MSACECVYVCMCVSWVVGVYKLILNNIIKMMNEYVDFFFCEGKLARDLH